MPRALTDEERSRVLQRLHTAGRDRFVRLGLAKTTIDALAKDAGIGKGSFYQFYPSKEALFIAIAQGEEQQFRGQLLEALQAQPDPRTQIAYLLRSPFERLDQHPFLALLLDPETISTLTLRLDPAALRDNEADDREFFTSIGRRWAEDGVLRKGIDPSEVFDAMAGLFLVAVQRSNLSPQTAERAVATLVAALVDRWVSDGDEQTTL